MRNPSSFRFCPHCSAALVEFVEARRSRRRCPKCHWIQYRNLTVGVVVELIHDGKLLLGKRKDGGWCIPCGHVEWDESVEEAAIRETREETGLVVALDEVLAVQSPAWICSPSFGPIGDCESDIFTPLVKGRSLDIKMRRLIVELHLLNAEWLRCPRTTT